MKKTYINPSMIVVRLAMTQPLATSPNMIIDGDKGSATFYDDDASSDGMVKGISDINIWDDDDEW